MDQPAARPALPVFEAKTAGGGLTARDLHDEPSPFHLSDTHSMGSPPPTAEPAVRPCPAVLAAAPVASPPWTPSGDAPGNRRRLEMPTALARLFSAGGAARFPRGGWPSSSSAAAPAEDAELECYLLEGCAYRRQRLPFGQGHLACGLARRGADDDARALWANYMALDAGQKAGVDRLLRRKTRTSTRPRTCVAITPCAGPGGGGGGGEEAGPPAARSPSFLVFLAVGHPVAPVQFRDPLGRRFEFSFELCRTWAGMEDLLFDCFPRVADEAGGDGAGRSSSIDARVRRGHYDLLGPDGHIVLPMVWESIVRPGWRVSMALWPEAVVRDRRAPPGGPHAAAAGPGRLWLKTLGVLRAPFEHARHYHAPLRAGPGAARQPREAPREILELRTPQPGAGEEEEEVRAPRACFASAPGGSRRHSSDWSAAPLPHRRLSPVYSAPSPEQSGRGSTGGSAAVAFSPSSSGSSSKAPSSLRTSPSDKYDDGSGGKASRSSSMPDCGSDTLETASLGKGIDDLLGRWVSAGADPARETDMGSTTSGRNEAKASEITGE